MSTVRVRAHAKVNLDLRITSVRPDGYHDLRTVFQALALHDDVRAGVRRGPFSLVCETPGVPLDSRNLAWKAAQALWTSIGRRGQPRDTVVHLAKQIPMQAGLGGGSADAAAALVALNALWRGGCDAGRLAELAATLGADVPFFLSGGAALGVGRGDEIYPLVDLPRAWVVLVVPPFGVSTQEAYGWYDADRDAGTLVAPVPQVVPAPWPGRAAMMANDLEPPVSARHPEIGRIRDGLLEAGAAVSMMSGSGSTVFGLFPRAAAARRAVSRLAARGWTAVLTHTLTRAEYAARTRPRRSR